MHAALNSVILTRVVAAVRAASFPADVQITASTRFEADLGFDSLDLLEVAACLEEAFDVEFPHGAIARFATISDVVAYLSEHYFRDVGQEEPAPFDTAPARPPRSVAALVRGLEPAHS